MIIPPRKPKAPASAHELAKENKINKSRTRKEWIAVIARRENGKNSWAVHAFIHAAFCKFKKGKSC